MAMKKATAQQLGVIMASLALLGVLENRAWAENYPLGDIDFVSVNHQTNIILHTGSIVPVQKVLISDRKLVLEIDQIEATDTIRTNFTDAGNISHVILQPINEHKIRLIIRGEGLGKPSLAFYNADSGAYSATGMAEESTASRSAIPFKTEPQALSTSGSALPEISEPLTKSAPTTALEPEPVLLKAAPILTDSSVADSSAVVIAPPKPMLRQAPETTPLPLPKKTSAPTNGDVLMDTLLAMPWSGYLPYALLGLVLLGLGLFIRNKVARLSQNDPQLEDLIGPKTERAQNGKRSSFREMADAYRSKRNVQTEEERPTSATSRKTDVQDVIGLHSLNQSLPETDETPRHASAPSKHPGKAVPATTTPAPAPAVSLEQLLSALQKAQAAPPKPAPNAVKARPAINPYVPPQVGAPTTRKAAPASKAQAPQAREADLKSALPPVNQALAARKNAVAPKAASAPKGSGLSARQLDAQGPLPGNPEVLNFLRNVADLMEKDGKADIAQNIHKKLNSQSLGLAR